ncbi:hypothetical protein UA08_01866 [Talaromyces atroroseus]|uniref:Uncharacterized protein n=1 Tax=Talaromyces atroroseus TaxID=1441469 RepID=A0A1Q5QBG1_TALAT|nr:hypothetical protein UA08_01866 [Talaromyces atroroseus]OKL63282.1 hypothetical protein UA08_01866 [Talaromyces atroroseus]
MLISFMDRVVDKDTKEDAQETKGWMPRQNRQISAKSDSSTKTGDKDEPTCQAKVKRADAPVLVTIATGSRIFLARMATGWRNEHYQLVARYVTIARRQTEEVDSCGNTKRVVVIPKRNWQGYAYDIRAQCSKVIFLTRTASATIWDVDNAKKTYGPFTTVCLYGRGWIMIKSRREGKCWRTPREQLGFDWNEECS